MICPICNLNLFSKTNYKVYYCTGNNKHYVELFYDTYMIIRFNKHSFIYELSTNMLDIYLNDSLIKESLYIKDIFSLDEFLVVINKLIKNKAFL